MPTSLRPGLVSLTLLAATLIQPAPAAPAAPKGTESANEPAPEESALLAQLADRAAAYKAYALGFTCEESVIKSYYDAQKGSFRRRQHEVYDYLFERSEKSGRLGEVRELIEENGKPTRRSVRTLDLDIPPSYAWSQIFAAENQGKFHFKLAGRVMKGYRLLLQIDFAGWAAQPGRSDIAGWSGRANVDSSTLNLYSIDAEPMGQAARVEAERLKYQRAFAIMGVPLAQRPKSWTLSVVFGYDNEGLTFPTETTLAKSVYVSTAEQGLEEKDLLRYRSYRFFKVGTEMEQARQKTAQPEPPAEPSAPAPEPTPPAADPNQKRR